ncbi:hypothetical protein [Haloplanus natans]|uniref:hypothetical protein n=1 Tax=Haloplanus natans TaxID=376171 RepID=UPI0006776FAC|nr:hypothetical protein [Haloplanus natans]
MTHTPGETVRDCLSGLDAAALTEFVAAVYAARGWTVEREGDAADLLATPPGADRPRRLAVSCDDAVAVAVRHEGEVTSLDADDVGRMAWYALDSTARERLFRDFLGADPDDFDPPSTADASSDAGADGEATRTADDPPERESGNDEGGVPARRAFAAGLAIVLVVAIVAATGPALTSSGMDGSEVDGADDTNSTPSDYSAAEAATRRLDTGWNATDDDEPARPGVIAVSSAPEPRPPGVTAVGIANASALADAHEAALDGRSYRLTVHHREFVDGAPTGFVAERTVVENATRYRTDLRWVGTVRQDPRAVGNTSAFANGQVRYVRLAGEAGTAVETELRPEDRVASRSERYLRGVLRGSDTRVVGAFERNGTTRFWIAVSRDESAGAETTGSLLVDEHGLVHELHHEYVYRPSDGPPVRVVVTMRLAPGNVSASPPPWLDDAP